MQGNKKKHAEKAAALAKHLAALEAEAVTTVGGVVPDGPITVGDVLNADHDEDVIF